MSLWLPILSGSTPSGTSYLLEENFEAPGFENSWTETAGNGTIDPDNQTSPPQGSYNLMMTRGTTNMNIYTSYSAVAETLYFFGAYRSTSFAANQDVLLIQDGAGATLGALNTRSTGALRIASAAATATTTGTMTVDTWYFIWGVWNFSTGAFNVEWQTTATKVGSGNNYASNTGGNTAVTAERVQLQVNATDGSSRLWDYIRVNNAVIGSDPP